MRTEFTLNPAGRTAIKRFRDNKPWQGTLLERGDKFAELHRQLCAAYDLETILLRDDRKPEASSAGSTFNPVKNQIVLRGRLSVVTYLFLFASACGVDRDGALAWAHETFRHFFPRSFGGCRMSEGLLVRDQAIRN